MELNMQRIPAENVQIGELLGRNITARTCGGDETCPTENRAFLDDEDRYTASEKDL